jgi:hypothetical protein
VLKTTTNTVVVLGDKQCQFIEIYKGMSVNVIVNYSLKAVYSLHHYEKLQSIYWRN